MTFHYYDISSNIILLITRKMTFANTEGKSFCTFEFRALKKYIIVVIYIEP